MSVIPLCYALRRQADRLRRPNHAATRSATPTGRPSTYGCSEAVALLRNAYSSATHGHVSCAAPPRLRRQVSWLTPQTSIVVHLKSYAFRRMGQHGALERSSIGRESPLPRWDPADA